MSLVKTDELRELSNLITKQVFGLCPHTHIRPVNPDSIQWANGAKSICDDCGWRTYNSDFNTNAYKTAYAFRIELAHEVVRKIRDTSLASWLRFCDAFEQAIKDEGSPVTTQTIIDYMMNAPFICRVALKR